MIGGKNQSYLLSCIGRGMTACRTFFFGDGRVEKLDLCNTERIVVVDCLSVVMRLHRIKILHSKLLYLPVATVSKRARLPKDNKQCS